MAFQSSPARGGQGPRHNAASGSADSAMWSRTRCADAGLANWKGFLRLSLVTCPVALYPATSDSEKISFNQINRKTGHRIKYAKVDADTGEVRCDCATAAVLTGGSQQHR